MSQSSKNELTFEREYQYEILSAAVFGAFLSAINARKDEEGLTRAELARLTGRDKTGISKLLSGPRNWTTKTVSDLCVALALRPELYLFDLKHSDRVFFAEGAYVNVTSSTAQTISELAAAVDDKPVSFDSIEDVTSTPRLSFAFGASGDPASLEND